MAKINIFKNSTRKRNIYIWLLLCFGFLAITLIPFFIFGQRIEAWADSFIKSASDQPLLIAIVSILLLASDILIPVPANETNIAAGFFLGFSGGLIASFIGRTLCCIIGFWLGLKFRDTLARRFIDDNELKRLEKLRLRFGDWIIMMLRPVPVLAEASAIFAGISRMPVYRFLLLITLSNLIISAIFSAVGAFAANMNSYMIIVAVWILIFFIAIVIMRRKKSVFDKKESK